MVDNMQKDKKYLYEFCFLWFTNCVLLSDDELKYDTRMLVTFGICFEQHFDIR